MKKLIKTLLREHLNDDGESKWMYNDNYKDQKNTFIHDAYENLTGYFGVLNNPQKTKRVRTILAKIFDNSMQSKQHGIVVHLNQEDALCNYFNTEDFDVVIGLIEQVFNGE